MADLDEIQNPKRFIHRDMILAIVQARMESTRLPGKVLKKVAGMSLIEILFYRLSKSKKINKIILATSKSSENNELANLVEKLGYGVYRGSENNVLDRYYQAAKHYMPDIVVRITGDCPITEPKIIDSIIGEFESNNTDYTSNVFPASYPDGLDVEVFSFAAL